MLTRMASQGLVDGLSALALGASVLPIVRQGLASPLRARLGACFGGVCLFLASRAAFEALGSHALELTTQAVACALPLAALVLAEGVLRRHAPRALKALVTLGGLATAIALVAADGRRPASSWVLGGYVVASLLSLTVLLLTRDRASLSRQENASVDALMASGALLTLLSVTDFLPGAPVGLSGLAAAAMAFVLSANPAAGCELRKALVDLLAIVVVAAISALACAGPLGLAGAAAQIRLAAIFLALLLAAGAVLRARGDAGERAGRDFALALADADTSSLDGLLHSLAGQPLLAGLRVAEGATLAEYDQPALSAAMASQAVWTPATLARAPARARDELGDLMARTEATHAVMLSQTPLRIALLTLPGVGPTDDAEADLALFRKLAAVAAQDRP